MHNASSLFDIPVDAEDTCCDHSQIAPLASQHLVSSHAWRQEVAYVIIGYPRLSETFITQEILILEELGAKVRVFAMKPGEDAQQHAAVARVRAPLHYLPRTTSLSGTPLFAWLRQNAPLYASSHWRLLRRRTLPYLSTLATALSMSLRYRKGLFAPLRKVFLKEFLQAGYVADQVIRSQTITHLHGHFCHGATTITWFASRMSGRPFSFTAHAKDIYQQDQNPGDTLERKVQAARFITTCTDANRKHLIQQNRCSDKIHTIYHGLDTAFFTPNNALPKDSIPLVLSVGRLVEKKGLTHLISACHSLRREQRQFRCVIVGEAGDQSTTLQAQIRSLGLEDVIEIHGPVTHDELRVLYARARAFVLPCLIAADGDRDGIPNVLAEAMAMALPVITTAVSGIPELMRGDIDGIYVPQRDPAAIAKALSRLFDDSALCERLGDSARERVRSVFDTRTTTVELKRLFERAMNVVV